MKRYYNSESKEWYTEGTSITMRIPEGLFSGVPTVENLQNWGFEEYIEPEPTEEEKEQRRKENRIAELKAELVNMDYLTSKYVDGEDMSQYGDWQAYRRQLREELRGLLVK